MTLYNTWPWRNPLKPHNQEQRQGTSISFLSILVHIQAVQQAKAMSNGNRSRGARLELQLHLSPPPAGRMEVDGGSDSSSSSSSPSSCVSSDSSPGSKSPMVIGACTRCMMYCMVAKKDFPTCINCKQPSLVDLLHASGGAGAGGSGSGVAGGGGGGSGEKKRGNNGK